MEEQCLGTTKAGARCKIKNNLVNGYCRIHQDQAPKQEPASESKGSSTESAPQVHETAAQEVASPRVATTDTPPPAQELVSDTSAPESENKRQTASKDSPAVVPPSEEIEKHPRTQAPSGERELLDMPNEKQSGGKSWPPLKLLVTGSLLLLAVLLTVLTRKR